jgi:hypothetical protein
MKKILILLLISLIYVPLLFSSNNLRIVNVRQGSWGPQGTIEKAVLSIHPKGGYVEHGLYLTFSDRGNYFLPGDSLEIQFDFELPKETYITDLWLWVEDSLMRALIMDRWTATNIYEDIVKRRRDPSLLTINDYGNYLQCNLRIFPLMPGKTRRIKITFLTPAVWTKSSVQSTLPIQLLKTSLNQVSPFYIIFWPESIWHNPSLPHDPNIKFTVDWDEFQNAFFSAEIKDVNSLSSLEIKYDNVMKNGIFLNTYSSGEDRFYQLAISPQQLIPLQPKLRKSIFLMDFLPNNAIANINVSTLLNNLKSLLIEEYSDLDSFNIIFSKFQNIILSNTWIPADDQKVSAIFNTLNSTYFSDYSNLPSLLADGISFMQKLQSHGEMVLISNSTNFGSKEQSNNLIRDVLNAMNPRFPIYIIDLNVSNYPSYWIDDRRYYGNEYFNINISRFTKGEYFSLRQQSLNQMLYNVSSALGGYFSSFDVYTTLTNGYTYSRFDLFQNLGRTYFNQPIFQLGRFTGQFPFHIQISGEYEGETIFYQRDVSQADAVLGDSCIKSIWTGKRIDQLKTQPRINSVISEMIDMSLKNRVLSEYTAFLALEPSDTVHASKNLYDESALVSVEEIERDSLITDLNMNAFPNPFNTTTNLEFNIPADIQSPVIKLMIYNIAGQIVKTFNIPVIPYKMKYSIHWNGLNEQDNQISSGIYIATLKVDKIAKSIRLLYLK